MFNLFNAIKQATENRPAGLYTSPSLGKELDIKPKPLSTSLTDNIPSSGSKAINFDFAGSASEKKPISTVQITHSKPKSKPQEFAHMTQMGETKLPSVVKLSASRSTGVFDVNGSEYVNSEDVELLGKLGFILDIDEYSALEKTGEVLDQYSYVEKIAGVPKAVVKAIDKGEAFSGEFLKDMDYSVPKGYEMKGDLCCPIEKEKTANEQHKLEAVVIKGNPKYLNNPHADKFYQNVADHLKGHGYNVSFDNGEPYTSPKAADLWVGHSRGVDRLRFAPKHTKTIALGDVGGINHSKDKALSKDGPIPNKWHFTLSDDMKSKIDNVIGKTKTAAADPSQTILVTGHSGAGKSTLAKALAEKLGLPLHRVDAHPEFKEYVTKDNEHWKESLTPGTKEYNHYTNLVNRANRDTLKASDPSAIIEGAQLGHLSPKELAKYKAHILVGGDIEQSIAQRMQRAVAKAAKKGVTLPPEEIELRKAKSKLVADYWHPGMEKFKKIPGVINYNHSEHELEPLIKRLQGLMKTSSQRPGLWANIRAKKARGEKVACLVKEADEQDDSKLNLLDAAVTGTLSAGTAVAGGLTLEHLLRNKLRGFKPDEPIKVVVYGGPKKMTSDPAAKTDSFSAQAHAATRELQANKIDAVHKPRKPKSGIIGMDYDAAVQLGDTTPHEIPTISGKPKYRLLTDFGEGNFHAPKSEYGTKGLMRVHDDPKNYTRFFVPETSNNPLPEQFAAQLPAVPTQSIPTADVFAKTRLKPKSQKRPKALVTFGGGHGTPLYFDDLALDRKPSGAATEFDLNKSNLLDDIMEAMRARYGDNFDVNVTTGFKKDPLSGKFVSGQPESMAFYNKINELKAAGDSRFKNLNLLDLITQKQLADEYASSHHKIIAPGSTAAEVMRMPGTHPGHTISLLPTEEYKPLDSTAHFKFNDKFFKSHFPQVDTVAVSDKHRKQLILDYIKNADPHLKVPGHQPVVADFSRAAKAIREDVIAARQANIQKLKTLGAATVGLGGLTLLAHKLLKKQSNKDHDKFKEPLGSHAASIKQAFVKEAKGRCWEGYKPVKGKKPYSEDSCEPVRAKKEAEYRWHKSKDLHRDVTNGRHYPFSYLTGEAKELVDAIKNRDMANFKEEIGDTSYAAQMLAAQATGLNHPVYADLSKFYDREKVWKDMFKEKGSTYHPKHMEGGSNYAKASKILKAFSSAGIKVDQKEAERLANHYTGGKMEKEAAGMPAHMWKAVQEKNAPMIASAARKAAATRARNKAARELKRLINIDGSVPVVAGEASWQDMFPFDRSHLFEQVKKTIDPDYVVNKAKYLGR